MNITKQVVPVEGDYYGVIYKGSLIVPVLGLLLLGVAFWWFLRKRKRAN